jgi:uncharacterized membrane protein YraQ (UPF0718 family)
MNSKKRFEFKGLKLFLVVTSIYLILFLFSSEQTYTALQKSLSTLATIAPIFLIITLLTAVINYFFSPKKLAKLLGKESGFRGYLIALIAGVVSHGPMYAWYPLIVDLKKHGLKSGLVVTFFYARGLKLPMIPIMIAYFGGMFSVVISLMIIIFSILQGLIVDKFLNDI